MTVNCINPGPVDTGYATGEIHGQVARMFPAGHWGRPDDVARLVAWIVSPEAAWITGQVLDSEGGFREAVGGNDDALKAMAAGGFCKRPRRLGAHRFSPGHTTPHGRKVEGLGVDQRPRG